MWVTHLVSRNAFSIWSWLSSTPYDGGTVDVWAHYEMVNMEKTYTNILVGETM